jgi:hypothetical protein
VEVLRLCLSACCAAFECCTHPCRFRVLRLSVHSRQCFKALHTSLHALQLRPYTSTIPQQIPSQCTPMQKYHAHPPPPTPTHTLQVSRQYHYCVKTHLQHGATAQFSQSCPEGVCTLSLACDVGTGEATQHSTQHESHAEVRQHGGRESCTGDICQPASRTVAVFMP